MKHGHYNTMKCSQLYLKYNPFEGNLEQHTEKSEAIKKWYKIKYLKLGTDVKEGIQISAFNVEKLNNQNRF